MTILPLDPAADPSPAGLRGFLEECRKAAAAAGRVRLASISIEVDEPLDPLAVLESIFDPAERHFYVERPSEGLAVAGAEAVMSVAAAGPLRFADCQRFIDRTLEDAIAVGDQSLPFAGPHFFAAFSFCDATEEGEAFAAASLFVPRWQVAQRGGRTVAVANLAIGPDAPIEAMTGKVWRAHAKFRAFDYCAPDFRPDRPEEAAAVHEAGGDGHYRSAVRSAVERIGRGELTKVVLARAKDLVAGRPFHPLLMLNGLRQRFGDCYAFSYANDRGQSFIGASPERLLRMGEGRLRTEALAGSIRRGSTASEDAALASILTHSDKDLREHRIVLEAIAGRLAPLGLRLEFPERPGVRRLANVQHLHTPIGAAVPAGMKVLDVLERLHPTPAVGGVPHAAALACIRELEPFPRGLYAGALGWLDARGGGEFFVGLRSALVDGPRARLYAGAGLVAGSSPDREWAETELKFEAMQEAFRPAKPESPTRSGLPS